MPEQLIECPECGHKFPLASGLRHGIENDVRKELEKKFVEKEKNLASTLSKKEKELIRREGEVKSAEDAIAEQVDTRLREEREKLRAKARKEAQEEVAVTLREQEQRVLHIQAKLKEAQEQELEVRRLKVSAEEAKREVELTVERRLDEERVKVQEKTSVEEAEKWQAQVRAKEEEIARIKKDLERAQRVGASGELMGEVAEKSLESRLRSTFEEDLIEPIGRGKPGADVLQQVHGGGSLLWESKDQYPNWSREWIPKLKRDRDASKAGVGVIVSTVGPDGKPLRGPSQEDGVVITPPWAVIGVASMLRPQLAELARQRRLYAKQETLQAAVYSWVTSDDFQRGVAAIIENLQRMESRVSRAKVNVAKWFRHMGEDVDLAMRSVAEFYGSARSHARLRDLPTLALNPGDLGDESDDESTD